MSIFKNRQIIVVICAIVIAFVFSFTSFGRNNCYMYTSAQGTGDFLLPWPVCSTVVVPQGWSESPTHIGGSSMEYALDFRLDEGTPVLAVADGIVRYVQTGKTRCGGWEERNNANYVVLEHRLPGRAPFQTLYLHLQSITVSRNQEVRQGQLIGYSGKTGWTGCYAHLHFQAQLIGNSWFGKSIPIDFADVPSTKWARGVQVHSENTLLEERNEPQAPVPTATTKPSNEGPNQSDLAALVRWINQRVSAGDYLALDLIVGDLGAWFLPLGVGFDFIGYDNGAEWAAKLERAIGNQKPLCLGYLTLSGDPKVYVAFSPMQLDSSVTGISHDNGVAYLYLYEKAGKYHLIGAITGSQYDNLEGQGYTYHSCQ